MALKFRADVAIGQGEVKGLALFEEPLAVPLEGPEILGVWKIRPLSRTLTVVPRGGGVSVVWDTRLFLFCEGKEAPLLLSLEHRWEKYGPWREWGMEGSGLDGADGLEGVLGPVRWEACLEDHGLRLRLWGDVRVTAYRREWVDWEAGRGQQGGDEGQGVMEKVLDFTAEQFRQNQILYRRLQQRYAQLGKAILDLGRRDRLAAQVRGLEKALEQLEGRLHRLESAPQGGEVSRPVRILRPPADIS